MRHSRTVERLIGPPKIGPVLVTMNPSRRPGSWRILRAAPACGGRYAWARVRPSGALEMQGCVCHHPWTLALRAGPASREKAA